MKSLAKILLLFPFIAFSFFTQAQSDPAVREMLYGAYLQQNQHLYEKAIQTAKDYWKSHPDETEARFQLAAAQYALLSYTMADQNEDLFDEYVDSAEAHLEAIIDAQPKHAKAHALLSGLYGLKIAYSPMKGMFLGSSTAKHMEKALKYGPDNPIVWFHQGSRLYNTPSMWGGDKEEALKAFEKAVSLFEAGPEAMRQSYRYPEALAWLGKAYASTEQYDKAKSTYEKALTVAPNFGWVKHALLPSVSQN